MSDCFKRYQEVVNLFSKTLPFQAIHKIERIQNQVQHEAFNLFRNAALNETNCKFPDNHTQRLFHGTSEEAVDAIVHGSEGFLPMLSGSTNGHKYGTGTYFARDASYAHRYAKHVSTTFYDDSDYIQVKQMILSDVFTGFRVQGNERMHCPPIRPGERWHRFNSMVDNVYNPAIYVVRDKSYWSNYVVLTHT
eukprot:m.194235 g.194235  ORF g.194235 m.194235 type:complete len:192 (+) comp15674_c0_seq10:2069-2644(+)